MKKRAFTLTEVLITLGIVGVLAAVMTPMVSKFKPDTIKASYLNTYDALSTSISTILSNDKAYPIENVPPDFNYVEYPLANLEPIVGTGTNARPDVIGGTPKFCYVLSKTLSILESDADVRTSCRNGTAPSFTAKNGAEFTVRTEGNDTGANRNFEATIRVDINGEGRGANCIFDRARCPDPDIFEFKVWADGEFLPADWMGIRYLETRTNLKYKKVSDDSGDLDRIIQERLDAVDDASDELKEFTLPRSANWQENEE